MFLILAILNALLCNILSEADLLLKSLKSPQAMSFWKQAFIVHSGKYSEPPVSLDFCILSSLFYKQSTGTICKSKSP